jgi:hypothetical protein
MANVYFGDMLGQADQNWNTSIRFTVSGVTEAPTAGATYTNNGVTFTVTSASIAAGVGTINAGGTGTSTGSGTLTKVSGTGDATIAFSDKEDVNWYSNPGAFSGCCCCPNAGTPLGRLPTLADTVIIYRIISIGPDISPWTSGVVVSIFAIGPGGATTVGQLLAGTFDGTASGNGVLGGTAVFNGAVTAQQYSGGIFNSTVTPSGLGSISGGTFNGTIVNPSGTTTSMGGSIQISGSPVFNCAIPNNYASYTMSGGIYDRTLVLGVQSPTIGTAPVNGGTNCSVTFNAGFSTPRNVTIYSNGRVWSSFQGKYLYGSVTVNGGVFTGTIAIEKLPEATISVFGGTYSPPAVTTPSVKSGNNMTFTSAALPANIGFGGAGGTFNPTILLSGTSNDIIGSGLP